MLNTKEVNIVKNIARVISVSDIKPLTKELLLEQLIELSHNSYQFRTTEYIRKLKEKVDYKND